MRSVVQRSSARFLVLTALLGAASLWPALAVADDGQDDAPEVESTGADAADGPDDVTPTSGRFTGLRGRVLDARTHEPLAQARIQALDLPGASTRTGADGRYALPLPLGRHAIRVRADLYRNRKMRVVVRGATRLDVRMKTDPSAIEEVLVEGRPDSRTESAAMEARKRSATVQDAVSAQEMSRGASSNAGDAVKRVVSATVIGGRYVFVRGLGGRYSTTLLNGVVLPSPDPDQSAVPLDIFPASLIANLTIIKSYTPDLPGTFAGGTLRIETNTYPSQFEFKFKAGSSWDSASTGRQRLSYASGPTDWLGWDGGHRALPAAVPAQGPVRVSAGGLDAAKVERIAEQFPNAWNQHRSTAWPALSLGVQVGDTLHLSGKKLGYLAAASYGLKDTIRLGDVAAVRLEEGVVGLRETLRSEIDTRSVTLGGLLSAGLEFGNGHAVRLLSLYTRTAEDLTQRVAGFSESDNQNVQSQRLQFVARALSFTQLVGEHRLGRTSSVDWQGNVSVVARDEPDTRDLQFDVLADGRLRFQNGPGSGERFFSSLDDLSAGGGANAHLDLGRIGVAFGGLGQATTRSFSARRFRFNFMGKDPAVLSLDPETMFSAAHIGPDFRLEERTLQADAYDAVQQMAAGFAKLDWKVLEPLRLIGGVRYEILAQRLTPGSPFAITTAAEPGVDRSDDHFLPALSAVYAMTPAMNLRAGYSYTMARPQLRELAPFLFFDFARRRAVSGNPALIDTRIHNADLRWEVFPSEREVFATSIFYKRFLDPIESIIVNVAQGDTSYANAPAADALGLELEARVSLDRVAPWLAGVRAAANVTFVRSEVDLTGTALSQTSRQRPLQGQSPYVVNLDLSWAPARGTELSFLYNVFGRRITDVGIEGLPDVYEQPFHRIDLAASQDLGKGLKLRLAATNLLFQPVVLQQGDVIVQRFHPGMAASASLEWSR